MMTGFDEKYGATAPPDPPDKLTNIARESFREAPPLDVDAYAPYVEELELTDEQKTDLLRTLWQIMASFVELGFGVDSIHQALPGLRDFSSETSADALEEDGMTLAAPKSAGKDGKP